MHEDDTGAIRTAHADAVTVHSPWFGRFYFIMDGTDEDVLLRMRDQADNFEGQTDRRDDKVNDGKNYAGMMSNEDYKKRRQEILEGTAPDADAKKRAEVASAVDSARQADRAAAAKEAKDRDERERLRKEKLQKELDDAAEPAAEGGGGGAAKKKKKRKLGSGAELGLSFEFIQTQ